MMLPRLFIRLHILHHAVEGELYGLWMIEELARHGYRLSPGTLYPLLHGLEKKGYLVSRMEREGRTARKYYRATAPGRKAIKLATVKAKELFGEIVPDQRQPKRKAKR
jgi:PadR family transcriptional regulator, regulatory protein PadR